MHAMRAVCRPRLCSRHAAVRSFAQSSSRLDKSEPPVSSTPFALTPEDLEKIVRLTENDPRVLMEVVAHLHPEARRRLIVTGGAIEWFGKENAAREMETADHDNDRLISPKDFDHWFASALKRKQEEVKKSADIGADTGAASPAAAAGREGEITLYGLMMIALTAGLPFVGFGFLDNATMILAGDAIDSTFGLYFHCSVLASAAMGNICSGILGMQLHGFIESIVQRFHLKVPLLTEAQMKDRRVFFAGHIGATVGIAVGLIIGMLPLLFLRNEGNEKADYAMFALWDKNKNGYLELEEFCAVLREVGLAHSKDQAQLLIEKYGGDGKINFHQFARLRNDIREGKPLLD